MLFHVSFHLSLNYTCMQLTALTVLISPQGKTVMKLRGKVLAISISKHYLEQQGITYMFNSFHGKHHCYCLYLGIEILMNHFL